MIALAFGFLRIAWPFLLLGAAYLWADNACWNRACKRAVERADEVEATLATVKAREAAIALKWADSVQRAEVFTKHEQETRTEQFNALAGRARSIAGGAPVRLSADASRVFADASKDANAARPPAEHQVSTPAVPAPAEVSESALALWAVESAKAYADAYAHWAACVSFYEELRHGQSETMGQ